MLQLDETIWDQNGFNELIHKQLGPPVETDPRLVYAFDGNLKLGMLPATLFCSGHTYFVQVRKKSSSVLPRTVSGLALLTVEICRPRISSFDWSLTLFTPRFNTPEPKESVTVCVKPWCSMIRRSTMMPRVYYCFNLWNLFICFSNPGKIIFFFFSDLRRRFLGI